MCVGVWVCLKEDMVYLFPAAVAPVLVALTILSLVCSELHSILNSFSSLLL